MDEQTGLELTDENVETVLDEIRPYLIGESFSCCVKPHDKLQFATSAGHA